VKQGLVLLCDDMFRNVLSERSQGNKFEREEEGQATVEQKEGHGSSNVRREEQNCWSRKTKEGK